ncbi:unnamed protein product [Amoebophrya sp. A120]|nr:unnamed protein product [Amoebophrya sp. A120]|eukprot:GSA120T00004076001.1
MKKFFLCAVLVAQLSYAIYVLWSLQQDKNSMDGEDPTSLGPPLGDSFSLLTWNVLSIGLRSNIFDVDPGIYKRCENKVPTLSELRYVTVNSAGDEDTSSEHELSDAQIEKVRQELDTALRSSIAADDSTGAVLKKKERDLQRSQFLLYALFRRNVQQIMGDYRVFSKSKPSPAAGSDHLSKSVGATQTLGDLLAEAIKQPAYLERFHVTADAYPPPTPQYSFKWQDCLGIWKHNTDYLLKDKIRKPLDLTGTANKNLAVSEDLLPIDVETRWKKWSQMTVHEWLLEDRAIYANPDTKKFSLSQGAKFFARRGLNAWAYEEESDIGNRPTTGEQMSASGAGATSQGGPLVVKSKTVSPAGGPESSASILLDPTDHLSIDFFKMRIYDLLMLKAWHDAALETDRLRLRLYQRDQEVVLERLEMEEERRRQENKVRKVESFPTSNLHADEDEEDDTPLPLIDVWTTLKRAGTSTASLEDNDAEPGRTVEGSGSPSRSADNSSPSSAKPKLSGVPSTYQADPGTHMKQILEVLELLMYPDIVLLQEVDQSLLQSKEFFEAHKIFPITAGEEQDGLALFRKDSVTGGLQTTHYKYVAVFASYNSTDPDNSVILIKPQKLRKLYSNSIEAPSPRILRCVADLVNVGQPVQLGSYHFSSGHIATQREFDAHIFAPARTSSREAHQEGNFLLLGGDLNTEPAEIPKTPAELVEQEVAAAASKAATGQEVLSSEEVVAKWSLRILTGAGTHINTYAKKLSVLQSQMTKADKVEKQNIDHVYGRGFTVVQELGDAESVAVRQAYLQGAKRLNDMENQRYYRDAESSIAARATRNSNAGVFGFLEKESSLYLPVSTHPLFRSDHMPIWFRIRPR